MVVGCEEERCREANKAFIHRVLHKSVRGQMHLTYSAGQFGLPGKDNMVKSLGQAFYVEHDAFIADGLDGVARLAADGDMPDSAARVVMLSGGARPSDLPLDSELWGQADRAVSVVVVVRYVAVAKGRPRATFEPS